MLYYILIPENLQPFFKTFKNLIFLQPVFAVVIFNFINVKITRRRKILWFGKSDKNFWTFEFLTFSSFQTFNFFFISTFKLANFQKAKLSTRYYYRNETNSIFKVFKWTKFTCTRYLNKRNTSLCTWKYNDFVSELGIGMSFQKLLQPRVRGYGWSKVSVAIARCRKLHYLRKLWDILKPSVVLAFNYEIADCIGRENRQ